jgi:NAD+ synthase (glutamine-hydrolysing)
MNFYNLHRHGFVRTAVAVPVVHLADPVANARETIALARDAAARNASVVVFPELGLSGYSCDDLFQQRALLEACETALRQVIEASLGLGAVLAVGLPFAIGGSLYNVAAVIHRGRVLGVVPKTFLPNTLEFYERRQFVPGDAASETTVTIAGQSGVPFGSALVFAASDQPLLRLHVEICEDLWTPLPPSVRGALAGATVLANLSASNVTIGKDAWRTQLVAGQSGRCIAAYLYSAAGFGESTTELAWDGHGLIAENGTVLARTERFSMRSQIVFADVDLERLAADRMRQSSFAQSVERERASLTGFRTVNFRLDADTRSTLLLERAYERFPYVPNDPRQRSERCAEVMAIQVQGLARRLRAMRAERVVIGVSGGLDSTHALVVCAQAMDRLGLPRRNILAWTLPGFATSERTRSQAHQLMQALGVSAGEIDIRPACRQMLADIGHPFARGEPVHDVTFENVQAGERTSHLFRLANLHRAPVVGTGDLSEVALGWSTYGVGDQMSHYNVNASVPKTLIQYLVRHAAASDLFGAEASQVLLAVLDTEISPELVPGDESGQPAQRSESVVGPYELQDFHLYHTVRFGHSPAKVAFLAWSAWRDAQAGYWPDVPVESRRGYPMREIRRWLGVFLTRFFEQSQYKRSAMPNAPKVGSGGSLSPRGDWRAPSDAPATVWIEALAQVPESEPDAP